MLSHAHGDGGGGGGGEGHGGGLGPEHWTSTPPDCQAPLLAYCHEVPAASGQCVPPLLFSHPLLDV